MQSRFKIKNISVIIPVYNSADTIVSLHRRIVSVLMELVVDYEIIFINDASMDKSLDIIYSLSKKDENIKYINLNKNFGQHNALLCGIRHAKYDFIVTMDDDLQNPPEEIPKLLEKIDRGYDVVNQTT